MSLNSGVMHQKGETLGIVTLRGYIVVPDQDLAAVIAALPKHIENTNAESGCVQFQVSPDKENRNRFNVFEKFKDKKAFEYHQQRTAGSHWAVASARAKRHYEITES
ncbi:MAG: antibiotic biosynthesis monooxygenase [Gammaproteobacteria bacterium]